MTEPEPKPIRGPVAIESVPWREWSHGLRFGGRVRHLSQLFGDGYHVGVIVEELPHRQTVRDEPHSGQR